MNMPHKIKYEKIDGKTTTECPHEMRESLDPIYSVGSENCVKCHYYLGIDVKKCTIECCHRESLKHGEQIDRISLNDLTPISVYHFYNTNKICFQNQEIKFELSKDDLKKLWAFIWPPEASVEEIKIGDKREEDRQKHGVFSEF